MVQSRVFRTLVALLVAGLLLAPSARADSQVRIVRLSLVEGRVQIDRATGLGLEKAIMNMPITQGMMLSVADDARAEIEFEDGTTMRLAPRTDVAFAELGLRSSGARVTAVEVRQGTAYFNVRHKGDDEFRVAFAGREIALDRSVHFRLDLTGGNPEIAVFKGELSLKGQENATVRKDETLTLDLADAGRFDLARRITPEAYDSWDDERLDYASQYAANSSTNYYSVPPAALGAYDLSYYGSWSNWAGYGMMWRPFGVGYGWDPFGAGAWAWYPGVGYTWVSTYPWGWTPYRYGSWVWVPNFGWWWRPGTWVNWYTVPPVYNPPPNYHPPKPPPIQTIVGGTGRGDPHPTVVVESGVGLYRAPRPTPRGTPGTPPTGVVSTGPAPATNVAPVPATNVAPVPGTDRVAPFRDPRTTRRVEPPSRLDRSAPPTAPRPDRVVPAPRPERVAPPRVEHVAPPPRVERSMPPPHVERSAPSTGGHNASKSPN